MAATRLEKFSINRVPHIHLTVHYIINVSVEKYAIRLPLKITYLISDCVFFWTALSVKSQSWSKNFIVEYNKRLLM